MWSLPPGVNFSAGWTSLPHQVTQTLCPRGPAGARALAGDPSGGWLLALGRAPSIVGGMYLARRVSALLLGVMLVATLLIPGITKPSSAHEPMDVGFTF